MLVHWKSDLFSRCQVHYDEPEEEDYTAQSVATELLPIDDPASTAANSVLVRTKLRYFP